MYLLAIHIPIFIQGNDHFVSSNWYPDVILARDWLANGIGQLTLLAPSLPVETHDPKAISIVPIGKNDDIRVVPSFDARCSTFEFWKKQSRHWISDVKKEIRYAKIIHSSAGQVYKPLWYFSHMQGVKHKTCTVLVGPDMDPHLTLKDGLKGWCAVRTFDHMLKRGIRKSDLALLKEGAVYDRYAQGGSNTKKFCHTMFCDHDVTSKENLEHRLSSLNTKRKLKAVFAGRFIARKGLLTAVKAIAAARKKGAEMEFHLFGKGPEEKNIRECVDFNGIHDLVFLHGHVDYSPEFVNRLAQYDILLFTPTEEDTPRMLYDGLAAGLPVVGSRIPFLECRVKADKIGLLANIDNIEETTDILCSLNMNRSKLAELSRSALSAGHLHSVDQWYKRRAEWTQQALERHCSRN